MHFVHTQSDHTDVCVLDSVVKDIHKNLSDLHLVLVNYFWDVLTQMHIEKQSFLADHWLEHFFHVAYKV